jgi:hypothetical protein
MHRRWTWRVVGWALLTFAACGGSSNNSDSACSFDSQCKGDRVCENGVCVDPQGSVPAGGTSSAAGSSGASATGGLGGTGGASDPSTYSGKVPQAGAGGGFIDDPELEQACARDCEARSAASCGPNTTSSDQCLAQCLLIDESTQGYCLDEMTARYACSASGGYTCVSGYVQAKATCVAEYTALNQCSQMIPCWSYCDNLPSDCAAAGADCVNKCKQEQTQFSDAICGVYYNQLLTCWGRGVTCVDGKPTAGDCGPAVAEVADCIGRRNHECDGFCWAAQTLGCGSSDCVATCKAKADASTCGSYYRNLIDCAVGSSRELGLSCEGKTPTIKTSECASYQSQYDTCVMTQ